MASESQSDRQKHFVIDGIILQYLQRNRLNETSKSFLSELLAIGRRLPDSNDQEEEDQQQKKNKQLIKTEKEGLLRLFDRGETEQFFEKLSIYEPSESKSDEYLKLEFSLQLHFAVFRLRSNGEEKESSENDVDQRMHKFKLYLENRGTALSQEPEFLPYFALPYNTNPSQHSSFKNLFSESWVSELRERLENHLDVVVKIKEKREDPRLVLIYNSYVNSKNIPSVDPATMDELSTKLQWERQKLLSLQANYQKLMHITTELLSALENSVRGGDVNLSDVMDTCLQAFPELFTGGAHLQPGPPPPPPSSNAAAGAAVGSSSNRRLSLADAPKRSFSLLRSETQDMLLVSLDYKSIKRDLISCPPRLKMFILQALRWRLTRCRPGEQRRSVLSAYISYDLLGTEGGQYGNAIINLIMSQTIELRQTMARFLNTFASLTPGRSYLSYGSNILAAVMDNVRLNKLETISLDMSLSTLQKLSLRRQLQTAMINNNLIEFLITILEDEDALSDYALEYTVALLMNLCLRSAGKERCIKNSRTVLKILTNLLGNQNPEIIPYVNGTLYSLLTVPKIKRDAQSMGLEEILNSFTNEASAEMRRQLEFILKQLASDDPVEDMTSDYEDEDDDDEDQDVLEEELDKDDVILVIPGELQGEALLAAHYSVHASVPRSKQKQDDSHPFTRPATPRIQPSSSLRRSSSSSQSWAVQEGSDVLNEPKSEVGQHTSPITPTPGQIQMRAQTPRSPVLNLDQYASSVLNEVVGIEKQVTEAVGFPPVFPRETEKFGGTTSVNEYVVAFSSRPKIPRTPEHSGRRSQSPYFDNSMFRDGL